MIDPLIIFLIVIFLLLGIWAPIEVRSKLFAEKQPRVFPLNLDEISQSVIDKLSLLGNGLDSLGFEAVGLFETRGHASGVHTIFALLQNIKDKTRAIVAVIIPSESKFLEMERMLSEMWTCYLEFITEFSDQTALCTNNVLSPGVFAKVSNKRVFQFPMLKEPSLLYEAHNYLRNHYFESKTAVIEGVGEEVAHLESAFARDYARQAEVGYYCLTKDGTKWRPTWKGAVLMTWKLMWPIGAIRGFLVRKKAKSILRDIGMSTRE